MSATDVALDAAGVEKNGYECEGSSARAGVVIEADDPRNLESVWTSSASVVGRGKPSWETRGQFLPEVVYCAFGFLLVFTAFNTAASTLTLVFPTFGATNLMIIFFCFGLASFFAPLGTALLHPKWCIFIAAVVYTFWVGVLMTGILALVAFASVLVGFASGLIWVSCGAYLGRSRRGSIANNAFWLIFFSSWLFGGVIGGIILNYLTILAYQAIMLAIAGTGAALLLFARALPKVEGEVSDFSWSGLQRPLRLFENKRMLLVLPTYLSRTCMLGYFLAQFPILVGDLKLLPYLTISTAIALTVFGVLFMLVWDRVSALVWSACLSLNHVTAMVVSALIYYGVVSGEARLIVLYVISGAFGVSEAFGMSLASHYGATLFPADSSGFFSCFRMCEGFSVGLVVVLATYTPFMVVISLMLFFALLSVACNIALAAWLKQQVKDVDKTQNPIETLNMPVQVGGKRGLFLGMRQATMYARPSDENTMIHS